MQNSETYSACPYVKKGNCSLWGAECGFFGVLYDQMCQQTGMTLRQLDQKDMKIHPLEYSGLKV